MNLTSENPAIAFSTVPHVRGDEPWQEQHKTRQQYLFPTCVGMNRITVYIGEPLANLFPTCVGMNRLEQRTYGLLSPVPHVRGDEPEHAVDLVREEVLFPTCVGMNRITYDSIGVGASCSPRAWG